MRTAIFLILLATGCRTVDPQPDAPITASRPADPTPTPPPRPAWIDKADRGRTLCEDAATLVEAAFADFDRWRATGLNEGKERDSLRARLKTAVMALQDGFQLIDEASEESGQALPVDRRFRLALKAAKMIATELE